MNWKLGLAIVFTLALIATLQLGMDAYSVQETILVLLVVAAGVIVVLLCLVTFVLFGEGVRLGFIWLQARVARITSTNGRNIDPREAVDHPRR